MKTLCLDIDDCVLPSPNLFLESHDNDYGLREKESLEIFKSNLIKINKICEEYGLNICLTSSWHTHVTFNKSKKKVKLNYEELDDYMFDCIDLINKYISLYINDLPSESNRIKIIEDLLKNKKNQLVILDDIDLSNFPNYINMDGYLTKEKMEELITIVKKFK